jgi:hypothetical protein
MERVCYTRKVSALKDITVYYENGKSCFSCKVVKYTLKGILVGVVKGT